MITAALERLHPLARGSLAALAGASFSLGLAPFNAWPIALLSIAAFYWLLQHSKRPVLIGWLYGLGFWGVGTSWVFNSIHDYGYTPAWMAAPIFLIFAASLALFHALQAWTHKKLSKHASGVLSVFIFAMLWVGFEWFRGWFLTGLPWLYVGYAAIDTPLVGFAPFTGIFSLSFAMALSAMLPIILLQHKHIASAAAIFLLWPLGFLAGSQQWTEPLSTQSVAMVQGNIPQDQKWQASMRETTLNIYAGLSESQWSKRDLIIWPEAAIPLFHSQATDFIESMQDKATGSKASLITGIPYNLPDGRFYNSVISLSPDLARYDKQRLVPFGEYIPLSDWIRKVSPFLPIANFSKGSDEQSPLPYTKGEIAPFICYETAYPSTINPLAAQADILVTLSNDGWFGASIGPHQHLQMAQMRAIEAQKYVLRATNTGYTAIITPKGKLQDIAAFAKRAVLVGEFQTRSGSTPYNRLGNWPFYALFLCFGFVIFFLTHRNKTQSV
ncbi:MAG: apolipoprotein N-acyltransferase [Pseudomonadota bacterium]|nr:apolipoprotein N-acyltransferase [Pseudomonadota bacterium]